MRTVLLLLAFLLYPHNARSQESPASVWRASSELEKTFYLRGFADGAVMARTRVLQFYRDTTAHRRYFVRNRASNFPPFDSVAKAYTNDLTSLGDDRLDAVRGVMDDLYGDSANACLPFMAAVNASLQLLGGTKREDVEVYLRGVRTRLNSKCGV